MPRQRRTQVIVVGGALAIASAAYGLGSQAGDGTAIAENSQNGERGARVALERGGGCGFSGLADELGVDESKLEQALRDFRSGHAQREDRFDRMGPRDLPPPPGGARFHFGAPPRRFEEHRKELAEFLADRLNLDVDKVLDALPAEGPRLRSMHRPGLPDHP